VQPDWNESNTSALDYIQNKPVISAVGLSGNYTDLLNKPTSTGWLTPVLGTGITNVGGNYAPAAYLQQGNGLCWLRGAVSGAKVGGTILTVPAAYYPAFTFDEYCMGVQTTNTLGAVSTSYNPVLINLSKAGVLSVVSGSFNGMIELGMICWTTS